MLVTELFTENYIAVKCNYSKDYVARFKRISTCYYDKEGSNKWIFKREYIHTFEALFKGEIVWKTPRWVIMKEPMPDYSNLYKMDNNISIPTFRISPFDYQEFGIKFMIDRLLKHKFVLNSDDVGLGKTLCALGCIKWFVDSKGYTRIFIACKKSIRKQWLSEIRKFVDLDDFTIVVIGGSKAKRKTQYSETLNNPKSIFIATYETIMNDQKIIESFKTDMLIIDEAHCVKAKDGKKHNALQKIADNVQKVIFLTGTPIMSRPIDVYGVITIADRKYFGMSYSAFEKYFVKQERSLQRNYMKTIGYKHLDELRDLVQEILIRRTEYEVNISLPKVIPKKIEVDLDKTQVAFIDKINIDRNKLLDMLENLRTQYRRAKTQHDRDEIAKKGFAFNAASKGYTACFQAIADDPRMFLFSKSEKIKEKYSPLIPSSYKMSNKTESLIDLLDDIFQADEKAIVFSKYERAVRMLKGDIEASFNKKGSVVKILTYTGQDDDDDREDAIELFQNNDEYKLLIGTDAMSEGLNLQKAKHVIHYDQPDTLATKTQRIGRTRRAGSKYNTNFSYDLITINSKDEDRLKNLERQGNLVDCVVNLDKAQSESLKKAMYG